MKQLGFCTLEYVLCFIFYVEWQIVHVINNWMNWELHLCEVQKYEAIKVHNTKLLEEDYVEISTFSDLNFVIYNDLDTEPWFNYVGVYWKNTGIHFCWPVLPVNDITEIGELHPNIAIRNFKFPRQLRIIFTFDYIISSGWVFCAGKCIFTLCYFSIHFFYFIWDDKEFCISTMINLSLHPNFIWIFLFQCLLYDVKFSSSPDLVLRTMPQILN